MNYNSYITKIAGEKTVDIFMFTLSTCVWCKKTKKLLSDLGVEYSYVDVDLVGNDVRDEVEADFSQKNPDMSFPTIIINGKKTIIGFNEDKIRRAIKNG